MQSQYPLGFLRLKLNHTNVKTQVPAKVKNSDANEAQASNVNK